jgi:hypothetical protein
MNNHSVFGTITSWNLCWIFSLLFTWVLHMNTSFSCHFDTRNSVTGWMFTIVAGAWNYGQQAHVYACCMVLIQRFIGAILKRSFNVYRLLASCWLCHRSQHALWAEASNTCFFHETSWTNCGRLQQSPCMNANNCRTMYSMNHHNTATTVNLPNTRNGFF